GDMIASLTAAGMGELDRVDIHYCWQDFVPRRGSALTLLEILAGGGVEWRDQQWQPASSRRRPRGLCLPQPDGPQPALPLPRRLAVGEQISVRRHVASGNVTTTLNASLISGDRLTALAAPLMTAGGLAMRTPLKRAAAALISRRP